MKQPLVSIILPVYNAQSLSLIHILQSGVHNVQREAQEHEAELERLGDAADKSADGGGQNQTDGSLRCV